MLTSTRASKVALLAAAAYHVGGVSSLTLPFKRQTAAPTTDPFNFSVSNFVGDQMVIYTANVTIDGQSFEVCIQLAALLLLAHRYFQVQLDTGSSDLWVNTQNITFANVNNTNLKTTIRYE